MKQALASEGHLLCTLVHKQTIPHNPPSRSRLSETDEPVSVWHQPSELPPSYSLFSLCSGCSLAGKPFQLQSINNMES